MASHKLKHDHDWMAKYFTKDILIPELPRRLSWSPCSGKSKKISQNKPNLPQQPE
jgi:hypothetical protein